MGLIGAAAWGFVGLVCLGAAAYAFVHGHPGCIEANVLIWVGVAALCFGLAAASFSLLAVPITVLALIVAIVLLAIGSAALVGTKAGCSLDFFTWALHAF